METNKKFEKTFELLEATGLNWSVSKQQLQTASGIITPGYGIIRSDSNACLGIVRERYEAFQNAQLAETIIEATDSMNIQTNRGGSLKGGAKVYLQAEIADEYIGKSGVKRWITALNSHDGSTSIAFGSTNTVVVCQNTFYRAYNGVDKFRHTSSAKARIEQAIAQLRNTLELDNKLMENFKKMADLELKDEVVERVIKKLFEVDPSVKQVDVSTRKKNQIEAFAGALKTEIALEGSTVWGLFNGITRYTNHVLKHSDESKKMDSLMDGTGYKISNMGFDEIMQWVNENTHQGYVVVG